jgi:hypothetical protein
LSYAAFPGAWSEGVPEVEGLFPVGESPTCTCPDEGDGGTGIVPGVGGGGGSLANATLPEVGVTGAKTGVPLADAGVETGSPAWHIEGRAAPMSKPRSTVLAIVFIDLPVLATWRPVPVLPVVAVILKDSERSVVRVESNSRRGMNL